MLKELIVKEVFCIKNTQEYQSPAWIFDFRKISLTSEFLEQFSELFFQKISENFPELKTFQVCGLESASIPLLSAVVLLGPKYGYTISGLFVRKGRKKSDSHRILEGTSNQNPIIIIDDILNSGKSISQQIEVLRNEKLNPVGVFSILRFRDIDFYKFITDQKIRIFSLFELNDFQKELNIKNFYQDTLSKTQPIPYEILWKTKKALNPYLKDILQKSHPIIDGDKIFYATDDGIFYCANKDTGETLWYKKIRFGANGKFIFSTPIIYKNKIFFGAYDGNFYCLDKNSGKEIWTYKQADWIGSSPCISEKNKLVYVGLEFGLWKQRGGLVALDIETGTEIWKKIYPDFTHSSPFLNQKENLIFCGSNDGHLRIHNPKTGEILKEIDCDKEIRMSFAEDKNQTYVCFGDFSGKIYIVEQQTLEVKDSFHTLEAIYSTPIWIGHHIVATSLDKKIYKYNTITKKVEWTSETNGRIFFNPVFKDNFLWVGSNDGRIYKVNFESGVCEGYIQFPERIINTIIFNENKIYLNTYLNEVYCIKLKMS